MSLSCKKCQISIYGDSFMRRLCPLLKKKLKLDIKGQLTMAEAEISRLHSRVAQEYKRQRRKPRRNDAVLIMVGTYEIMCYEGRTSPKKYGTIICRKLRSFVKFLSRYHQYIIIVTALPVWKKQKKRKYWQVLTMYNASIASMADRFIVRGKVSMVNLFPMFMESLEPPRCNTLLFERFECPPYDMDVIWNNAGMEIAVKEIREADNANPLCPLVHFISGR